MKQKWVNYLIWNVNITTSHWDSSKKKSLQNGEKIIGRVGNWTQDLSHAKGARYQLRHTPDCDRLKNMVLYKESFFRSRDPKLVEVEVIEGD